MQCELKRNISDNLLLIWEHLHWCSLVLNWDPSCRDVLPTCISDSLKRGIISLQFISTVCLLLALSIRLQLFNNSCYCETLRGGTKAAFTPGRHVARQQVARSGYMLPVSRQHNYYSFMSRSTCIPLYPATDGQQTGNNFVADILYIIIIIIII